MKVIINRDFHSVDMKTVCMLRQTVNKRRHNSFDPKWQKFLQHGLSRGPQNDDDEKYFVKNQSSLTYLSLYQNTLE